jgi:hypothetical protein
MELDAKRMRGGPKFIDQRIGQSVRRNLICASRIQKSSLDDRVAKERTGGGSGRVIRRRVRTAAGCLLAFFSLAMVGEIQQIIKIYAYMYIIYKHTRSSSMTLIIFVHQLVGIINY